MISLSKSKWFVVSLVVIVFFQIGDCIQCFEGNLTAVKNISCSGSCRKFVMEGGSEDSTEYTCCPEKKPNNCTVKVSDKVTTTDCYCSEDLCNSSRMVVLAFPFLLGSVFVKMIL
ncbi:uncharacterized protein [Palaemon carinicauda]|uniref:uncharacterized protein n=1 Tax=Palaemon carinicauda TaxID=392227 RepID=UPI0035B667A0